MFPYFDALAEALVKADGRGAVAVVAPSGLSLNDVAHVLHEALPEALLHGAEERLGDAVLAAQSRCADSGASEHLLAIYHLFGDSVVCQNPVAGKVNVDRLLQDDALLPTKAAVAS